MSSDEPHPSLLRELSGKAPMPKAPVLSLPRPKPRIITRTYTDPEQPGVEVTLTLRSFADNPHAALVAGDHAEAFAAEYRENWYPHPSGEAIEITETVAQTVCGLEAMQCGPAEERYTRDEILGLLLAMPNAWMQIARDVAALNEPKKVPAKENGHDPNSSRVPVSTSCAPSATVVSGTPTS